MSRENVLVHIAGAAPDQELQDAYKEWKSSVGQCDSRDRAPPTEVLTA
ncbi:hypothetical protein GF406_21015 [candidate division KSB1 bacterium]|nr:hypothetical protein [candidate division KSB1 bacterium]